MSLRLSESRRVNFTPMPCGRSGLSASYSRIQVTVPSPFKSLVFPSDRSSSKRTPVSTGFGVFEGMKMPCRLTFAENFSINVCTSEYLSRMRICAGPGVSLGRLSGGDIAGLSSIPGGGAACQRGGLACPNEIVDFRERALEDVGRGRAGHPGLGHVGPAPTTAAQNLRDRAHELPRMHAVGEVLGHHREQGHLAVADAGEDDDPRAELAAEGVADVAQRLGVGDLGAG